MVEGTLSFDMTESTKKRNRILHFKAECGVGLLRSRLLLNSRTVIHKDKGPWLFRILIQCLLMSNKTVLNELVTTILFKNTFKPLGNVTSQDGSVTEGFWCPSVRLPGPYMKSWPTSSACLGQSSTLLGPGGLFQPSRISLVEKKKKKSKTALLVWCETWREVTRKPRGPGWGPVNRAQQDKGKQYSSKAQFCVPLVGRRQCYPVGVGRRQSPLNPHDPADREHRRWPWSPRRRCPGAGLGLGLVSSSAGHLTLEASQFGFHVFSELRESFSHHAVSRDKEPGWFLQDVSQCFGTAAVPRSK